MNKKQKEILAKAETWNIECLRKMKFPVIYILPQNKKHDSGYKMMYVLGWKNDKFYYLSYGADVLDLGDMFNDCGNIHIDIKENGVIRLWSNRYDLQPIHFFSNCTFNFVEKEYKEDD